MKALSIRQPWAWMILNAGKDIENRTWSSKIRGRVLIHAAKGCTNSEFYNVVDWARFHGHISLDQGLNLEPGTIHRGGIIGSVEIVDCVKVHASKWKESESFGFVLANPIKLPFFPCKGALGFFDVPDEVMVPK